MSRVLKSARRYLVTWRLKTPFSLCKEWMIPDPAFGAWFRPSKQFINILNDIVSEAPYLVIFNRRDSLWDPLIRNNKALQTYFTLCCVTATVNDAAGKNVTIQSDILNIFTFFEYFLNPIIFGRIQIRTFWLIMSLKVCVLLCMFS